MSLVSNLLLYVDRVAVEFKSLRTIISGSSTGDASALTTTATNVVGAINEVKGIADAANATAISEAEVDTKISTALGTLIDSAPGTLDTLNELAAALGDDPNFAATITTSLGLKANAADVYTKTEVGDVTTDFVAAFNTALAS